MASYPHAAAHLPRLTRAWGLTYRGATTRQSSLAPYRARPALVAVGEGAVPAPATPPPPGWPQCPDPRPGWRVSIHPQPTRAPRGEAMALGPLRGRGPARAVVQGPTPPWGVAGTTGGTAAAALRLPLAPGVTGTAAGGPPPPYPPPSGEGRGPESWRETSAA